MSAVFDAARPCLVGRRVTNWLVLAGGRGTRFGQPKIFAEFGPGTFLSHCLAVIAGCSEPGDRVIVSVADDSDAGTIDRVADSAADAPFENGVTLSVVGDRLAEAGPAHAIGVAADATLKDGGDIVIMAVDMLGVRAKHLAALRAHVRASAANAQPSVVVARRGDRPHWTLAAIPECLAPKVVRDAESVSSLQSLYLLNPVLYVDIEANALLDVNTPSLVPPLPERPDR